MVCALGALVMLSSGCGVHYGKRTYANGKDGYVGFMWPGRESIDNTAQLQRPGPQVIPISQQGGNAVPTAPLNGQPVPAGGGNGQYMVVQPASGNQLPLAPVWGINPPGQQFQGYNGYYQSYQQPYQYQYRDNTSYGTVYSGGGYGGGQSYSGGGQIIQQQNCPPVRPGTRVQGGGTVYGTWR